MALLMDKPEIIEAAGNKPKIIEEFFGRVRSDTQEVSIARMKSPAGWEEPGQCAEYMAVCLPAFSPKTVHRDHQQ